MLFAVRGYTYVIYHSGLCGAEKITSQGWEIIGFYTKHTTRGAAQGCMLDIKPNILEARELLDNTLTIHPEVQHRVLCPV